jgi:hypothetical protein
MRLPSEVTVAVVLALALALSRRTQDERRTGRRQEFQESATRRARRKCHSAACPKLLPIVPILPASAPMRTIGQSTKMRT